MLERKNIDRVFQENFKDLEVVPNNKVWNNIEKSLQKKERTSILPLWQKLSGIAMVFLFLSSIGLWYFNNSGNNIPINSSPAPTTISKEETNVSLANQETQKSLAKPDNDLTKNNLTKKKPIQKQFVTPVVANNKDIQKEEGANHTFYESIDNRFATNDQSFKEILKQSNQDIFYANNSELNANKKKTENKKWSVGPTISPIYYNTLSSGSPLNENLTNNSKSSDNALSVGVKVNYQLTKKINLQSGVNKIELAYNTNGVNAAFASSKSQTSNIKANYNNSVILNPIKSTSPLEPQAAFTDARYKNSLNGNLNQSIEYFELPFELKYNLYESKFGVNVIGGFSTLILTNNSVTLLSQNNSTNLGQANNLNSVNFSGNVGIDLDYKINKSWYLNVAPMFKYQFNTYSNNSGNFQPYYLGVYSGLNYRF